MSFNSESREQSHVRLGKRKCRWCGEKYRWPIGSKSAGCPQCQPDLFDAVEEISRENEVLPSS